MPKRRWAHIVAAVCLVASLLVGNIVTAEDESVSVQVGGTTLEVTGQTSPAGFVTVIRDGSVIGTTTADANGDFGRTFTAQEPGIHEISVSAHTTGGADTDTVTVSVSFAEHTTTTVHIFLPPTVVIEDTTLDPGQNLVLSGEGTPSSTVNIFIDNSSYTTTTSDNLGNWNASINTDALGAGEHSLFVRLTNSFGQQSYPTASRSFTIAAAPTQPPDDTPTTPPTSGIPGIFTPPAPGTGVSPPNIPVITFPTPGIIWDQPTITVTGTADPGVQIELWDGDSNLSSTFADDEGNWSIRLGLVPKDYQLRARACNQGVCSGFSDIVPFTAMPGRGGLYVKLKESSFAVYQNQPIKLLATILGGKQPYTVGVVWDDQTNSGRTASQTEFEFNHTYMQPGEYMGRLDVTDAQGLQNSVYFTVSVLPQPAFTNVAMMILLLLLILLIAYLVFLLIRRRRRKKNNERSQQQQAN